REKPRKRRRIRNGRGARAAPTPAYGRGASLSPFAPSAASAAPNCGARPRAPANSPISPAARTRRPGPGNTSRTTTSRALTQHMRPAAPDLAPSANAFGAATVAIGKYSSHAVHKQGDNQAVGKFRAQLWHCRHTSSRGLVTLGIHVLVFLMRLKTWMAGTTVMTRQAGLIY